jgi:fructose-bisphosphate aldolase class I
VTELVQRITFQHLHNQGVAMEGMVLKPSMVISGSEAAQRADTQRVAEETLRCLLNTVPAAVTGIAFLSGGQSDAEASGHLNAMHKLGVNLPWGLTFSYGRALQQAAMTAWGGKTENVSRAQKVFLQRAMCNGKAALGAYTPEMEKAA